MRVILLLLATTAVAAAAPKAPKAPRTPDPVEAKPAPPAPPPRTPGPDDAKATAALDKIVASTDAASRKTAIAALDAIAPQAIDAIGEWLQRAHTTDIEDRRGVLTQIKASVPDKTGRFSQPVRQTGKEQKADDDIDWLTELVAIDNGTPLLGEVIADDAAIRALAASKDVHAAQLVFDTAFGADTMIYRDECGRYLRKMEPFSIPALTKESQGKDDRKRYATWQLERLDRQEPHKALAAATGDEAVTVAILDVFRTTHHREAVHAVWSEVDADSPRVRKAARDAWEAYITGPAPPPAPRKKLQLPGGKLTKKEKPLWLTYRELADNELRKAANELLHEDYPIEDPTLDDTERERKVTKVDLQDLTTRLFAYYDGERGKRDAKEWDEAAAKAKAGDLAGATQLIDRMLAANPERTEKAEMAKLYLAWGKQLETKQQWDGAAAAYSKAHGLDPTGPAATKALAASHYTLGKALEAQGKDGGPDFRIAIALQPDYAPAQTAAQTAQDASGPGRPAWMLYGAAVASVAAMLLFAAAMLRRRA